MMLCSMYTSNAIVCYNDHSGSFIIQFYIQQLHMTMPLSTNYVYTSLLIHLSSGAEPVHNGVV